MTGDHFDEDHPPVEAGGSCDWGWCDRPFHSWRWAADLNEWLPVCSNHRDRTLRPAKNQREEGKRDVR